MTAATLYHLVSLGCAKNRVDSENIMGLLGEKGYTYTPDPGQAEVIIVNTCSFITPARKESVEEILQLAEYKQDKCRVLLVAGCLPARYRREIFKEIPRVDGLVTPANLHRIPRIIDRCLSGSKSSALGRGEGPPDGLPRLATGQPHSVYVKIADGCNHTCSFCIIPRLRGPYKSRPLESILGEAERLVSGGARELNLIAQDTSFYGMDLYGRRKLPELLQKLAHIEDLAWLRILYAHPLHVDEELLETMAGEEKVCPYLDLPLQHCAPDILKKMYRGVEGPGPLLEKCRDMVPGIALRSTFITGFPGERSRHFRDMLDFLQEHRLDRVGIFPYSREEGTPAAGYPHQVPSRVIRYRYNRAMAFLKDLSLAGNKKLLGRAFEVMVDRRKAGDIYTGRYYGQAPEVDGHILFPSSGALKPGQLVRVRVVKALDYDLEGEVCQ